MRFFKSISSSPASLCYMAAAQHSPVFLLGRLRVGAHLLLLQTTPSRPRREERGAVLGSSAGCWMPWVSLRHIPGVCCLCSPPAELYHSMPGLPCEALEDGEVSSRKALLFLLHMTSCTSQQCPLPSMQQQSGLYQPWKHRVHPGDDDLPYILFLAFLEEKR